MKYINKMRVKLVWHNYAIKLKTFSANLECKLEFVINTKKECETFWRKLWKLFLSYSRMLTAFRAAD